MQLMQFSIGCRPFVQVYENGKLVKTTEHDYAQYETMLKCVECFRVSQSCDIIHCRMYTIDSDDHIDIPLGVTVQGDIRIVVAHAQTLLGLSINHQYRTVYNEATIRCRNVNIHVQLWFSHGLREGHGVDPAAVGRL